MPVAPLDGLRGALVHLETPLFLVATARVFLNLTLWATGLWKRQPRFVVVTHSSARFACVATATVALFGAAYIDNAALLSEFEQCTFSKSARATGLVTAALLLLFFSSTRFFIVVATILGLRLVAQGSTSVAFVAANLALVDEPAAAAGSLWNIASALAYAIIVYTAQAHYALCGNRNATVLAAVAWAAGLWYAATAFFYACRVRMRRRRNE